MTMRTIVMLLVVLLVGCGAAEGPSYDGSPVLGGEAGALVAPDETGGTSSSTGGTDATGGVLVATGGQLVTGGASAGGTGGEQATGGADPTGGASTGGTVSTGGAGTGGAPDCSWATVDNCAAATNGELLNYFADADCSVQLFPSPKQLVNQGLIGCQRELVPGQGIQAVEAWKLGSSFGGSSWWRLTDEGCELTTENVPAQYGYPYFYMAESVELEQATRQEWTCK